MSETKNECEIVNRLSRKVEKELSENMTEVNASLAEVNEKIADMAIIDDSVEASDSTWSSSKIKEEIDAGGGGGADFDDNIISSTKGWTSSRIWDVILHKDKYYKEYKGTFGRVSTSWYTMFTINLADLYTDLGLKFTYTTTDSFSHGAGVVNGETVEFVGDHSGKIYHSKHVSTTESNPIRVSGKFNIQANEIDSTDTGIIARIKCNESAWSASFTYDCAVQSFII